MINLKVGGQRAKGNNLGISTFLQIPLALG